MQLVSATGQLEDVPDAGVQAALASGKYGLPHGDTPVANRFGKVGVLPSSEAVKELAAGRVTLATPGALQASRDEREYGGVGGGLAALGEGALRGASVGLSDPAILAAAGLAGDDTREAVRRHMAGVQAAHPYLAGAGELAGTIAPALLTGGASEGVEGLSGVARLAGEGLGAPLRATEAIGGGVEAAARSLAGETASSALVRAAQRGIATGARGMAEGALFGGGQEISEESLGGDPDLHAEKILASMGHGALLGGAFGGLLGTGESLAKSGALALADHVSPKLAEIAENQTARALTIGSDAANMRRAEALPGGVRAMSRRLLDDRIIAATDTVDTLAPKVEAKMQQSAQQVDAVRALADASGAAAPDATIVADRMRSEMSKYVEAMPKTNAGARRAIDDLADDLASTGDANGKTTFQALAKWRSLLDDKINWNPMKPGAPINIPQDALKTARGIIEDELEKSLDAADKHLGEGVLKEYKAAKLEFRQYRAANDLVQEAASRKARNRVLSPSDYGVLGATGAGAIASGHPLGAITGIASGLAHKMIREHGNAFLASTLDKAAQLGAIRHATAQVDRDVTKGVRGFISRAKTPEGDALPEAPGRLKAFQRASGKSVANEYEERATQVQAAALHPNVMPGHVANITAALAQHAPKVAAALQVAATRATVFLASKLPQKPPDDGVANLTGKKKWAPAEYDQRVFLRYARAVDDPVGEIHAMAKGRGTKQGAEAVRAVVPKMFEEAKREMLAEISVLQDKGKRMPSTERAALANLWDIPTDWSHTPKGAGTLQQVYAQSAADKEASKGPPDGTGGRHSRQVATSKSSQMAMGDTGIESARIAPPR